MKKYLQRIGKSLMLPVAVLPICGILMGIGYALCPATMQGGDIEGFAALVGFFLVKAGGALIDNMAWLFAVGVAVGMAKDKDGTAGLAGLVSWLMITKLLNPAVVTTLLPSLTDPARTSTALLAFGKIENAFIGILAGLIGSACYNRFRSAKLPDWLSFFSGKRCVAIVTGIVSVVVAAVLLFLWPVIFGLLVKIGNAIVGLGAFGAGIYAFLNRLLIPTGLHHALNNVFWFDTIGLGDLSHFLAGDVTGQNGVTWSLGMYMSGFFPCMMFGIPGAALAMIHTARPGRKKIAVGLVGSAALCAFVCGVTEPFEFAFMFLSPVLYVVYALLYGILTVLTTVLGFRAGFAFSAGATDLIFSASMPAAARTWMIVPLGVLSFVLFYTVFRIAIVKFDLKTPGREDDDQTNGVSVAAAMRDIRGAKDQTTGGSYAGMAAQILAGLGGKGNIVTLDHCITRLRLEIKDYTSVDEQKIKAAGARGVMRPSKTTVQVIIGTKVQFVADELAKLLQ